MLARFHQTGKMMKVPSDTVEMTPNNNTTINLAELNAIIADQKGVTVGDLALADADGNRPEAITEATDPALTAEQVAAGVTPTDGVLSDADLAAQYRSQADAIFKEAKALREQAEELVPTKKKSAKKTVESV